MFLKFPSLTCASGLSKMGKIKRFNLEPKYTNNIDKVSELSSANEKSLSSRRVATLNKNSAKRKTVFSSSMSKRYSRDDSYSYSKGNPIFNIKEFVHIKKH